MAVIHFEIDIEDNLIRIPEQYMNQIPTRVSVTLADAEKTNLFEHDKAVFRDLEAASMSSMDFWDNEFDEVWDYV